MLIRNRYTTCTSLDTSCDCDGVAPCIVREQEQDGKVEAQPATLTHSLNVEYKIHRETRPNLKHKKKTALVEP